MATSATPVAGYLTGGQLRAFDIFATADADVALAIAHGFSFQSTTDPTTATRVTLEPRGAGFYTQNWFVASITVTTLNLTKSSVAVGTGLAGSQVRVFIEYLAGLYA